LGHRNKMLKDTGYHGTLDQELVQIIDEQLVQFGVKIFGERADFAKKFIPVFQKYYSFISDKKELVDLEYISDLMEADFSDLLMQNINKDKAFQYTTTGVHKDDLLFNLAGYNIKRIGSQGQQKTYLVALKLANFEFISSLNNFKPIILLDDIFDKFDTNRVKKIIQLVADDNFGQIFITDTNRGHIQPILDESGIEFRIFDVDKGTVEQAY
jgi:DNA replication and repair protein RecF